MTDLRNPPEPGDADATAAFDTYFREELAGTDFRTIDPATIATGSVTHRRPHSRRRWLLPAAAAVLLVVVGAAVVRPWLEPRPIPADVAPVTGEWLPTAAPPLANRYDALTFFADGRFYLLGGYTGLTMNLLNGVEDEVGQPAFDSAAYDPVTDSWTTLPSFDGIFNWVTADSAAAVIGDRLYVVTPADPPRHVDSVSPGSGRRELAVLDLRPGGAWTRLAAPPDTPLRANQTLVARGGQLFLFGADYQTENYHYSDRPTDADAVYDTATNTWQALPASPVESLGDRQATALDPDHVLVTATEDYPAIPGGAAILSLADRTWRTVDLPEVSFFLDRTVLDGRVVIATAGGYPPDENNLRPTVFVCTFAGIAGASEDHCDQTELAETPPGGLRAAYDSRLWFGTPPLALPRATAVEAFDNLYDPVHRHFWTVPLLPGDHGPDHGMGRIAVQLTAGPNSLLACFGIDSGSAPTEPAGFPGCSFLRVPIPLPDDSGR